MPARIRLPRRPDPSAVLVVGSVAYDSIETPHASGERILGGSASYAALAASYFAPVQLVGVVGHDFAAADRRKFERRGIDLSALQVDETGRTFFWRGRYHENYNRRETLELELNVFERFHPRLPASHQPAAFAMLGNIRPDLQLHVLDQLTGKPFVVADTIDIWIETARDGLNEVLRRADLAVVNDTEATKLTGETNAIAAGRALRASGCRAVIVKKGEHGAVLFHEDGLFALPAYPVTELRDPTGAGDTFAGSLLGYLAARGETDFAALREAMGYATAVASLTVEAFSCERLASAGCAEIRRRRRELGRMTRL
ncbi:MAG: PfkB family carbohydrate kinase [Opitutales bacterium]|jgi:sugar/nucleoside kinase (ribokinase family)